MEFLGIHLWVWVFVVPEIVVALWWFLLWPVMAFAHLAEWWRDRRRTRRARGLW